MRFDSHSNTSNAVVVPGPTAVSPFYSANTFVGAVDNFGGIQTSLGTAGSYVASDYHNTAKGFYSANAFAELYSGQRLKPLNMKQSTFTITPSNLALAFQYIGIRGTSSGTTLFQNTSFRNGIDTISPMPVLTANYTTAVPEPATGLLALTAALLFARRRSGRSPCISGTTGMRGAS